MPTPAVFVVFSVATSYGGMTRTVLARARLYADAGIPVKLLVVYHTTHEDREETTIRQAWGLLDSVEFCYFWREAPPAGGGAPTGEAHIRPTVVREHDEHDQLVATRHVDPHGRLVRIDDYHPGTGTHTMRRWFDQTGQCWLTCWMDDNELQRQTVQHGDQPVAFDDFNECLAAWIDQLLDDHPAAVVFSDKRDLDPAVMAIRHPGVRKVATLHNAHQAYPNRTKDATKANWLPLLDHMHRVDEIVTLTNRQARDITDRHGHGPITVLPHPASTPEPVQATREPGLLVTVGRLVPQKRLQHAIRAFATVAEQLPHARYDLYGTGPKQAALETLVTELGLDGRVRFRGHTDRPLEVFAAATATVLSSRYEGWGIVLTEAMSVGTPAIAYNINYGPDEIIRHEIDGLLVSPGDIDGLAEAMLRLLGDSDYTAKLGDRAREVTDRFSHQRWRADWLDLFNRLATTPRPVVADESPLASGR